MSKAAELEGYNKLPEPGISNAKVVQDTLRNRVRCIFVMSCFLAVLSIAVLFISLCQISHNFELIQSLQSRKPHLHPPFSRFMQESEKGVHVASGSLRSSWPDPPPHDQVAKVARYIVHISEWASIATFSVAPRIKGYPFANILSLSDGPVDQPTGVPYMYLTPMDLTSHDLSNDTRASLSMSEAQSDYCHKNNYDPENPLCARILITGNIVRVENGTAEEDFAKSAVFSRHPEMKDWPVGHQWFFAKMNISHIYVLDFFGGAAEVDIQEYFDAIPF